MGSIFFITYVLDVLKHQNPKEIYKDFAPKVSKRARNLMFINIPILLISGLYMLFFYYDFRFLSVSMIVKLIIAGIIVFVFYTSDWITEKTDHIHWFHHFFHHTVIAMMIAVVILSQVM
jgi:hypothetical protein